MNEIKPSNVDILWVALQGENALDACVLFQVLSTEREKHAAIETELNMKNLGLADKLKEARGELTGE